jgi:hypothetical protein
MNCSGKNTGNFNRIDYRIAYVDETALDGTIEDDIDITRNTSGYYLDDTK